MRVGLLHYSGPPMVGGVEQTLLYHARELARLGHEPVLIVGQGAAPEPAVELRLIPELYSMHPRVMQSKAELDQGQTGEAFQELRRDLEAALRPAVADLSALIVHNALTLHKNLALTAALWALHQREALPRLVGWHHDLAWDRPGYRAELHPGEPWDLLRRPWPGVSNVVVSHAQRARLAGLYGVSADAIHVISPGVDPALTGRWTPLMQRLVSRLDLLAAEVVLLLPARVTRRKNIEFALPVLGELRRQMDTDVRLLVSGPPGPHNPANLTYLQELLDLRRELGLEGCAHFLYQLGGEEPLHVDDETMANLYAFSDALFFPSRNEGFGIPLLEAGLTRLPIFCSDISPFHESAGEGAHYFPLQAEPQSVAEMIAETLAADPAWTLRHRVLRRYTWGRIVSGQLLPLLGEGA